MGLFSLWDRNNMLMEIKLIMGTWKYDFKVEYVWCVWMRWKVLSYGPLTFWPAVIWDVVLFRCFRDFFFFLMFFFWFEMVEIVQEEKYRKCDLRMLLWTICHLFSNLFFQLKFCFKLRWDGNKKGKLFVFDQRLNLLVNV